jgi:hypothetical protein
MQSEIVVSSYAVITGGSLLINRPDKQVIELELQTEKPISSDLIDVGSSFSIFP